MYTTNNVQYTTNNTIQYNTYNTQCTIQQYKIDTMGTTHNTQCAMHTIHYTHNASTIHNVLYIQGVQYTMCYTYNTQCNTYNTQYTIHTMRCTYNTP